MHARTLLLLATAALIGAGGLMLLLGREGTEPALVSEHPAAIPRSARTVALSTTMPRPSAAARRLSAMLEEGAMPARPVPARVLTDTQCAPDERMISRCRNELRLADGRTIVVRHPHDMRSIPCLAPGERVLLLPATA
ncbi:MAG TPA: hypothetical protein VNJ53_06100 [Gaiellaceae bacterium]|nr:hypothetical protein [Gaiellaceae bacterium]